MTNMTAVEWLEKELKDRYALMNSEPFFQQALEMEKQQICKAFDEGWIYGDGYIDKPAKEYYSETYKSNNL